MSKSSPPTNAMAVPIPMTLGCCSKIASRSAVADPPDRLWASPSLIVRSIRSIWSLVYGWFGLISLCSIPFVSQIMSTRIYLG